MKFSKSGKGNLTEVYFVSILNFKSYMYFISPKLFTHFLYL